MDARLIAWGMVLVVLSVACGFNYASQRRRRWECMSTGHRWDYVPGFNGPIQHVCLHCGLEAR